MPILAAMRKGETRRVRKSVRCSVHDLGDHRQGAHGPRSYARNEQQFGEVDRCPIRCCSQIGVKARRQHVAWADIVMSRHDQMRQRELHRNGLCVVRFSPTRQGRQFARDPVWTQGLQNAKLTAARGLARRSVRLMISPCPIPSMAEWGSSTKLFKPSESQ